MVDGMAMGKSITEPQRQTPVLMSTDIVVVGGGTTGPFAAISAARQGKRVVMVERFGSLGGNMALGLNTKPSGAPFVMGTDEGHASGKGTMQPVSMYFTMNQVDIPRLAAWARGNNDIPARAIPDDPKDSDYGLWLTGFNSLLQRFQ